MNIVFSDMYRNTFAKIADKIKVTQTIEHPDKSSIHELGDKKFGLYVKKYTEDDKQPHYIWVLCLIDDSTYNVSTAFIMLATLHEAIDSMTPIEMLEAFLEIFGLVVESKYKLAKLIYHETFWDTAEGLTTIWTIKNPPEKFIQEGWIKKNQRGSALQIESSFVFAVDMGKYEGSLADKKETKIHLPSVPPKVSEQIMEAMKLPSGTISFKYRSHKLFDSTIGHGILLDTSTDDVVFKLERDADLNLHFIYSTPSTGTRIASVDIAPLKGGEGVYIALVWSPEETRLHAGGLGSSKQFLSGQGIPS